MISVLYQIFHRDTSTVTRLILLQYPPLNRRFQQFKIQYSHIRVYFPWIRIRIFEFFEFEFPTFVVRILDGNRLSSFRIYLTEVDRER